TGSGNTLVLGADTFTMTGVTGTTFSAASVGSNTLVAYIPSFYQYKVGSLAVSGEFFYILSSVSGQTSVSVTANIAPSDWSVDLSEWSHSAGTPEIDSGNTITSASCSTCLGPTIPLTGSQDVVIQGANPFGQVTGFSGSGGSAFVDLDAHYLSGWAATANVSSAPGVNWMWSGNTSSPFAGNG